MEWRCPRHHNQSFDGHGPKQNGDCRISHTPNLNIDPPLNGLFNSGFRLLVTSDFGVVGTIEGSTNLADWDWISTVTNTYGTTQVTDPRAVTNNAKFYRLMLQ